MASPESRQIRATLVNDADAPDVPLTVQRQEWEQGAAQTALPPGITIEAVDVAGMTGEWISSPDATQQVFYLLHGGGYTSGSCVTHRELAARLCLASGLRVLLLNYRLAPEHRFPAAVDDAAAGYRWLLAQGIRPGQIALGGDSAGGGLALAALLRLRDQGLAMPAAGVLLSPWLDLALIGESMLTNAAIDPLCSQAALRIAATHYLDGADPQNPLASPVYADLRGLPPLLVQVGSDEVLLSDSTRLAERARVAGGIVELEVWEEMWHVWHGWAGSLPKDSRRSSASARLCGGS